MSRQATQNAITLKGSTEIVAEFFGYSINSILYMRGVYPASEFEHKQKYGLTMMVSADSGLTSYLGGVLKQLAEWLAAGNVQKLVVVIAGQDSGETLERWVFDVQTDKSIGPDQAVEKPQKEITSEIQAIIRQITASVTFLPLLEEPCTFDLLVYTDADVDVPKAWEESDPKYIASSDEVKLRSFTTKVHKGDTMGSYKADM